MWGTGQTVPSAMTLSCICGARERLTHGVVLSGCAEGCAAEGGPMASGPTTRKTRIGPHGRSPGSGTQRAARLRDERTDGCEHQRQPYPEQQLGEPISPLCLSLLCSPLQGARGRRWHESCSRWGRVPRALWSGHRDMGDVMGASPRPAGVAGGFVAWLELRIKEGET